MRSLFAAAMIVMMSMLTADALGVPGRHALLLTGARVLDPPGETWRDGVSVLVAETKIARIAPEKQIAAPDGIRRIDLAGFYLLPGLIDLHTHLLLHPYDETPWDEQVLKESLELRTIRAVVSARATLEAGFTTLRDLGTEGAGFADVALRDAISHGLVPGLSNRRLRSPVAAMWVFSPTGRTRARSS